MTKDKNTTPQHPYRNHHTGPRGEYSNNRRYLAIEAALRRFAYHGYAGVTSAIIGKAPGITLSSIFKLFKVQ